MGLLNKKNVTSSAEVVDKHLILSLPNATEPVVWRMALDKIGTASFEVKQIKKSEAHKLVLKPKKGNAEQIASFENKDTALSALIDASTAMQSCEKRDDVVHEQKTTTALPQAGERKSYKWLYLFLSFLVVIALYIYMAKQIPNKINNFGSAAETALQTDTTSSQIGVPLSADDFLNNL